MMSAGFIDGVMISKKAMLPVHHAIPAMFWPLGGGVSEGFPGLEHATIDPLESAPALCRM